MLIIQSTINQIDDKKYEISAAIKLNKTGTVFEKGTTVNVVQVILTIKEKGSGTIKEILFYVNNEVAHTLTNPNSDETSFVFEPNIVLTDSISNTYFRVQLKDSAEVILKANTSAVNFYYPCYYGVTAIDVIPDEAAVKAMTKLVVAKSNQACTFTMARQSAVFVYPASYGNLTSITDPSGFEQINGFTKHTISITGADNKAQSYNMYIGPSNTNTNFKLTFKF